MRIGERLRIQRAGHFDALLLVAVVARGQVAMQLDDRLDGLSSVGRLVLPRERESQERREARLDAPIGTDPRSTRVAQYG